MEKKVTSHIVKGLIISLIIILISIVAYIMGQDQSSWQKWLSNIVLFGGVIISCIIYSNELNNNVTFGNVFAHGFKVSAVVTCIIIIFSVLFILIMPDIKEKAIEAARLKMQQQGQSEQTIQTALDITNRFLYVFVIAAILFFYLLIGLFGALIGAAVAKKNPSNPFEQQVM